MPNAIVFSHSLLAASPVRHRSVCTNSRTATQLSAQDPEFTHSHPEKATCLLSLERNLIPDSGLWSLLCRLPLAVWVSLTPCALVIHPPALHTSSQRQTDALRAWCCLWNSSSNSRKAESHFSPCSLTVCEENGKKFRPTLYLIHPLLWPLCICSSLALLTFGTEFVWHCHPPHKPCPCQH